jgi:hypothetical protein
MQIVVSGLPKAREDAVARVNAHYNNLAARFAHDDALDLRRRLKGEAQGDDPVELREAERQKHIVGINAATSVDEIAEIMKQFTAG